MSTLCILAALLVRGSKSWRDWLPHLGYGFLVVIGSLAALALVVWALVSLVHLPFERAFWMGFGILFAVAAVARVPWWWEHDRIIWLRRRIGDLGAVALYAAIGAAIVAVAAFAPLSWFDR